MWRDRDGVAAVIVAITLPVIVSFAALAIDMSYAYWTRTQLQHAASAAALAGAIDLVDEAPPVGQADSDAYRRKAVEFAYKNMTKSRFGRIIHGSCGTYVLAIDSVNGGTECADVKAGNWNPVCAANATGSSRMLCFTAWDNVGFNPATMKLDAVRVVTRKAQMNGNPLNLFLGAAVGLAETDISTVAVAWAKGGSDDYDCFQNGMIAGNLLDMQSNNIVTDDYCMYGENGVSVQSDNSFDPSTQVGMGVPLDEGDPLGLLQQGNNSGLCPVSPDDPNCVAEGELGGIWPKKVDEFETWLDAFLSAIEGGNATEIDENWPSPTVENIYYAPPIDGITDLKAEESIPGETCTVDKNGTTETVDVALEQDFVYISDGTASITSDATVCNVVIIADKIDVASGVTLRNVTLIANDTDTANANISFGADFDIDNVVLAAKNRVQFGSLGEMGGDACNELGTTVGIYAGEDVFIASNTTISNAAILAEGNVDMGSNNAINLTGNGATIQAKNNIWVASDGYYGACPNDNSSPGSTAGLYIRLVD